MATIDDLDATLVTVGVPCDGGCCWVSFDPAAEMPTTVNDSMADLGWESAGEPSEDGFTEGKSVSSNDFKGWHGTVLLSQIEDTTNTLSCSFVEVNRGTAAKIRYGADNVEVDDDGTVAHIEDRGSNNDEVSIVIDEIESAKDKATGGKIARRTLIRRAKVTDMDDVAHQRGELMVYGMTFTALKPADTDVVVEIMRGVSTADTAAG